MKSSGRRKAHGGSLRIISGELKGRRIPMRADAAHRPTAERVREALFSILGDRIAGARVLDAYGGSGALGFEALSRGAREVWFVEVDPDLVGGLKQCAERFGVADRLRVIPGPTIESLEKGRDPGCFDLIFVDPPYESSEASRFLDLTVRRRLLGAGGTLVHERRARTLPLDGPPEIERARSMRYGDTALDLFCWRSAPEG